MTKKTEIIWHQVAYDDWARFSKSIPGSEFPDNDREVIDQDGRKVIYLGGNRWRHSNSPEWEDDACVLAWAEVPTFISECAQKERGRKEQD